MRAKIALNFFSAGVRGHVFEATLCGAMLLESGTSDTSQLYEPMVEYVPCTNADLVEKARYYLEHDAERIEIARRGHEKATERYTGERFWATVFARIFSN